MWASKDHGDVAERHGWRHTALHAGPTLLPAATSLESIRTPLPQADHLEKHRSGRGGRIDQLTARLPSRDRYQELQANDDEDGGAETTVIGIYRLQCR